MSADIQSVKFDNLYDILYNKNQLKSKSNLDKNVHIGSNQPLLNFLEDSGNLKITNKSDDNQNENKFDVSKIKITK